MQKDIKFRVWDKKSQEFFKTDNFWIRPHDFQTCFMEWRPDFDGEMVFETKESNFVYQQFTGFLDKNKKEIFVGDILDIPHTNLDLTNSYSEIYFRNGGFVLPNDDWLYNFSAENTGRLSHFKICGNIFENPELLK